MPRSPTQHGGDTNVARGRFISRSISENEQLGSVSWQADFLFGRMVSHLDVEGRISANPVFLKSRVVPLRHEIEHKHIPKYLDELAGAIGADGQPLLVVYEVNGAKFAWFPAFERQQEGLRKDREKPSTIPAPPRDVLDKLRTVAGHGADSGGTSVGHVPLEVEVEVKEEGTDISGRLTALREEFAKLWLRYPKRTGGNPRVEAERAYIARRHGWRERGHSVPPVPFETIEAGLERYRRYCDAPRQDGSPTTGTEYVMQAKRFFGASQPYLEAWDPPQPRAARAGERRGTPQSYDYPDAPQPALPNWGPERG
jgi:hypothetical protein